MSLVYKRGKLSRLRLSNLSSCLILLLNQMSLRRSRSNTGSSCGTKHPEALAGYFRDVIPEGVQVAAHTGLTGEERKGERRSPLGSITWTPVSLLLIPLILDSGVTLGLNVQFEGTLGFSFTSASLESFSAPLMSMFFQFQV